MLRCLFDLSFDQFVGYFAEKEADTSVFRFKQYEGHGENFQETWERMLDGIYSMVFTFL